MPRDEDFKTKGFLFCYYSIKCPFNVDMFVDKKKYEYS